ncbi:MAG: hypothetical protein PVH36_14080 [Desulfobacterales bacterium]|jgi:hypothetical protein
MKNRTEKDVLEMYKHTDQITRNQIWIRFPAFRKAFDEIDDSTGNNIKRQVSGVVTRAVWCKKEK